MFSVDYFSTFLHNFCLNRMESYLRKSNEPEGGVVKDSCSEGSLTVFLCTYLVEETLMFICASVFPCQDVTADWDIRAMPTFLFIKNGKQIDKIVGANKDELEKKVHHYATNQS